MLESNVGAMKVELSHTMAQIEQMTGMIQQPLQAKSADGGHEEESQAEPVEETQTMTAAAPEGHCAKMGLLA